MIRRVAVWGSWAFATAAWMLWVPVYYRFPLWWGGVLLAAAGLLAVVGDWGARAPNRPGATAPILAAIAAAGAFAFLPKGLAAALAMLSLGLILLQWGGRVRRGASGLRRVATVAIAEGVLVSVCSWGFGTTHGSGFVSFFDHWIGRALGLDVSAVGRSLYYAWGGDLVGVTPSWDQFGLLFIVLIAGGCLVDCWLRGGTKSPVRTGLLVVGGAFAYGIVRHVAILLVAIDVGDPGLFWRPAITLGSFVPLLVAALALPDFGSGASVPRARQRSGSWTTGLLVLAGAALLCVGLYLQVPGDRGVGRVLFDEAHGDWESTVRTMDTEWYGMPSTYNYHSLFEWLSYYYEVDRITGSLADASLDPDDVLILKTPSIPYEEEEIEAIAAHVRAGGGLFGIGDHTNVFGTTSVLNPVLARFGIALDYNATYSLRDGSFTIYRPSALTLDPVMQHVEAFDYLTSCTLVAPKAAYAVMYDGEIITNQADYATRDFFSPDRFALSSTFGLFGQAAAVPHGLGRAVVFTDSTCFSNFSMHMDGYPAFFLGTLAYLQTGGASFPVREVALAVCGIGLATALGLFLRRPSGSLLALLLVVGTIGWCAGSVAVAALHRSWYPLPRPIEPIPYVYFDFADSGSYLSPQPRSSAAAVESEMFDTFFVWTQRVGLVPVPLELRLGELVPGRPYVLANPRADLSNRVCERIASYVRDGGALVLMGRPQVDRDAIARILSFLDLKVEEGRTGGLVLRGAETVEHVISPAMTLETSSAGCDRGRVVLLGDSTAFSDLSFGGTFTVPSDVQRRLYDVAFALLREIGGATR